MSYKQFKSTEIFHNVIKTHPKFVFHIHQGKTYLNNEPILDGEFSNKIKHMSNPGYVSLYEMNVNRPADSLVYPFITKDGARTAFSTVSKSSFNSSFQFGDKISGQYPHSASISRIYIPEGEDYQASTFQQPATTDTDNKKFIRALKGPLKEYRGFSRYFEYSSSFGSKGFDILNMIGIPSIFYGSQIKKGSIILRTYVTGTLVAEAHDKKSNGELIETTGSQVGAVAGVAMYNHGLLLMTGSWNMDTANQEPYISADGNSSPKWTTFGAGMEIARNTVDRPPGATPNTSYEIIFEGTNEIPTLTMLAHAEKAEMNMSSNPTFVDMATYNAPMLESSSYSQPGATIKNIVKSPYAYHSASFEKTTYITKIGIYDKDRNLIGFATLANPVKKKENRDYTFKLKLDF